MKKRYDVAIEMMMLFFLTVITLSFAPQLADMDFMPRMLTASFFMFPFMILTFIILRNDDYFIPRKLYVNSILASFIIFLLAIYTSYFKSINPNDSLFELLKFYIMLGYLLVFVFLFFKSSNPFRIIARGMVVSHTIVLIAGVLQIFAVAKEAKRHLQQFQFDYQISSVLSTKNSLAEYLLLVLPFIIYGVLYDKKAWKIIAIANGVCCLLYMYALKSFAIFIALFTVILSVMLLLFIAHNELLRAKSKLSPMAFNIVMPGLFILLAGLLFLTINKADGLRKLSIATTYISGKTDDVKYNDNSVFERLLLWRNSIKMIREHPLTGVGLANWKLLFPHYGYSGARYLFTDTVKFTRPHNDFLQVFAETGIVGFLSYLLFFISLGYVTIKNYLKTKAITWLILLSGLLSYFMVSLFGFPMERVLILLLFILYASLILAFNIKLNEGDKFRISKTAAVSMVAFFAVSIFSLKVCMARMQAEVIYKRLVYQQEHRHWQRMYQMSQAFKPEYFPVDYMATPIAWYQGAASYMNNNLKEAQQYYKKAEQQAPYHVQVKNDIGAVYLNTGDYVNAEKYFAIALKINPNFYESLLNETFVVFNTGNKYGAYKMFKGLYAGKKRPNTYTDNLKVIVNAVADSVIKSVNFDLKNNPEWVGKFNKDYIWSVEQSAELSKLSFIEQLNKEINLYR